MKILYLLLALSVLAGCTNPHRRASYNDEFEAVKVDQVVGNNIALRMFEKTIVCLNPRREVRLTLPTTNQVVSARTNLSVQILTNQLVMMVTNITYSYATNQLGTPAAAQLAALENSSPATNTEPAATITNVVVNPAPFTNVLASSSRNVTVSKAPNQHSTVENAQSQSSQQIVVVTNNVSVSTTENRTVTTETNWIVTFATNSILTYQTNQVVSFPEGPVADYYLSVELTQPADFVPVQGESLVLVVDGVRYGFTATNSPSFYLTKRGFSAYLYKASPQLILNIANAREVRMRLRGTTTSIERRMSQVSRNAFKRFLTRGLKDEIASVSTSGGSSSSNSN